MSHSRISIVTPSYNQADFIEETICSVLDQNYPNLQYLVIDGGSNDGSAEIIKRYEQHLDYWVSEPDEGQSHAINIGLSRCNGDIFNWINSHDYYKPNALEKVNDAFNSGDYHMACFTSEVFGLENRISRGTDIYPGNLPKAIAYSRIDQPETFLSMEAVKILGPLNTELHYCMDKEWLLRYFLLYGNDSIYKSDDCILNFRYHEDSKSVSLQERFAVESDRIFASLALQFNKRDYAETIARLSQLDFETLEVSDYELSSKAGFEVIDRALDYYLFKRFIEHYERLDKKNCKKISELLDPSQLNQEDYSFYRKLSIRDGTSPDWAGPAPARATAKIFRPAGLTGPKTGLDCKICHCGLYKTFIIF